MVSIPRYIFYIGLALISLFGLCIKSAKAVKFSQTYFFGDSLTDSGTGFNPFGFATLPPVTSGGANRQVWASFLANRFEGNALPRINARHPANDNQLSSIDNPISNTNYAVGGFNTLAEFVAIFQLFHDRGYNFNTLEQMIAAPAPPPPQDILDTLIRTPNGLNEQSLYSVWIGANDLLMTLAPLFPPGPEIAFEAVIGDNGVLNQVKFLVGGGAKHIMVLNLPAIDKTPVGVATGFAPSLTRNFNTTLLQQLNALNYDIIQISIEALLNDVIANPISYGFTNSNMVVQQPPGILGGGGIPQNPNPDENVFLDGLHPTQKGHQIIAQYVLSVLTAPDFVATFVETALDQARNTSQQSLRELDVPMSKPSALFVRIDRNKARYTVSNDRPRYESTQHQLTIGAKHDINNFIRIGSAMHYAYNTTGVQGMGSYNSQSYRASFMAGFKHTYGFIQGITHASLDAYNKVTRYVRVGAKLSTPHGDTSGFNSGLHVKGGLFSPFLPKYGIETGPFGEVFTGRGDAAAYGEVGGVPVDMAFRSQSLQHAVTSIGWLLRFKRQFLNSKLFVQTSFARSDYFAHKTRIIGFNQTSLPGSHGSLPISNNRSVFYQTQAHVGYQLGNGTGAYISAIVKKGGKRVLEYNTSVNVALPLG